MRSSGAQRAPQQRAAAARTPSWTQVTEGELRRQTRSGCLWPSRRRPPPSPQSLLPAPAPLIPAPSLSPAQGGTTQRCASTVPLKAVPSGCFFIRDCFPHSPPNVGIALKIRKTTTKKALEDTWLGESSPSAAFSVLLWESPLPGGSSDCRVCAESTDTRAEV